MKAFNDVKRRSMKPNDGTINGQSYFNNISAMQVGSGTQAMRTDKDGMWFGAEKFDDAPLKFSMAGSIMISDDAGSSFFNARVLIFYNSGVPEIVIGDPTAAP
jgi:hypothetical protein